MAAADLFISAITILELKIGTVLIERRDGLHGGRLQAWLIKRVLPKFTRRTPPVA
ncbi:MAG: hypothetical protein U1E70_15055 [Acetobacteraceae bacterium]|nr:hypothetical protein [Pseudomonadota bacterium]